MRVETPGGSQEGSRVVWWTKNCVFELDLASVNSTHGPGTPDPELVKDWGGYWTQLRPTGRVHGGDGMLSEAEDDAPEVEAVAEMAVAKRTESGDMDRDPGVLQDGGNGIVSVLLSTRG